MVMVLVEAKEELDLSMFRRDDRSYWLDIGVAVWSRRQKLFSPSPK
jgi:hypothetical protein